MIVHRSFVSRTSAQTALGGSRKKSQTPLMHGWIVAASLLLPSISFSLDKIATPAGSTVARLPAQIKIVSPKAILPEISQKRGLHIVAIPAAEESNFVDRLERSPQSRNFEVNAFDAAAPEEQVKRIAAVLDLPGQRLGSKLLVVPHEKIAHLLNLALPIFSDRTMLGLYVVSPPQNRSLDIPIKLAADHGVAIRIEQRQKTAPPYRMPDGLWTKIAELAQSRNIKLQRYQDASIEAGRLFMDAILFQHHARIGIPQVARLYGVHPNRIKMRLSKWSQFQFIDSALALAASFPGAFDSIRSKNPDLFRLSDSLWTAVASDSSMNGIALRSATRSIEPRKLLEAFIDKLRRELSWQEMADQYRLDQDTARKRLRQWNNSGFFKRFFITAETNREALGDLRESAGKILSSEHSVWIRRGPDGKIDQALRKYGRPPRPGEPEYGNWMAEVVRRNDPALPAGSAAERAVATARKARAAAIVNPPALSEELWGFLKPIIEKNSKPKTGGRIPALSDRRILETFIAALRFRFGYSSGIQTVQKRLAHWKERGVFHQIRAAISKLPTELQGEFADVDWSRVR